MSDFTLKELYAWCSIPYDRLEDHPELKVPFRIVKNSEEMGSIMARELAQEIVEHNKRGKNTRAIIPCGPSCWYKPFTHLVNEEKVSLKNFEVFHMDDCLDWQGRTLPREHPYNFRTVMERVFYRPVDESLAVPDKNRNWLLPHNIEEVRGRINSAPVDVTYGGWGQDGHVAYRPRCLQSGPAASFQPLDD
jgi:glucosamine-6-phosphate deaminase